MADDDKHILAASTELTAATQAPTTIDAEDLDREARDDLWRDFCRDADRYVAESTRPPVRASETASL
jgi:hypothetical protein